MTGRQGPTDTLAEMLNTSGAARGLAEMGKMVIHANSSWPSGQKSTGMVTRHE